jgi:hypothetical protein
MSEKRARTPAQVLAFERCKMARENNLRKKIEEQNEVLSSTAQPSQAEDDYEKHAQEYEVDQTSSIQEEQTPSEFMNAPRPQPQQAKRSRPQTNHVQSHIDDDNDYIELDTDSLFSQLESHKKELNELREHIHGLRQGHEELQTTWQQHDVGRRTGLSFV